MTEPVDVAVIGAGPVGLTAAVALAVAGVETALIAGRRVTDNRTTALLGGSVTALERLGVWTSCAPFATPLTTIRLVDDTGRLLRAPEIRFDAAEIGRDAFGWDIENRYLLDALDKRAADLPKLRQIEGEASSLEPTNEHVAIALAGGERMAAKLVVGADGRHSLCRRAAQIGVRQSDYPQIALTFNLSHDRPHQGISTEFHTTHGPFTLVPLPGWRSSLVWVVDPTEADRFTALDDEAIATEIERRSHSILGKIQVEPGRGRFPLRIETAERFGADRIALVGEAAHTLPPIGAQGLNLGLRDAASIAELAAAAVDPGADAVIDDYDRHRRADAARRQLAVDLLNRSLLADFLPVQAIRSLGLIALDCIGPLRRALMQEGIAPHGSEPALMREEAAPPE